MNDRPVTLLTGAGSGIGRGFAMALARLGSHVIVTDIDLASAESVAAEISAAGGLVQARQFDVVDGQAARSLVDELIDCYGRIDHLFANAGILGPTDLWEITPKDWDAVLGVNIKGAAIICQLVAAQMKEQRRGRIIVTASYNGVRVDKHVIPYRVSKAGLLMFTKCLSQVMAPYGVTVNAICPGVTLTPLQQTYAQALADQRGISLDDYLDERRSRIPMGELTTTADLNALARFLVSDEARLITGQSIAVDGGVMASS